MILNIDKYIKKYIFANLGTPEGDIYYCDCGNIFKIKSAQTPEDQKLIGDESDNESLNAFLEEEDMLTEFKDLYKGLQIGLESTINCPVCNKNFQSYNNKDFFIINNEKFISGYKLIDDELSLKLIYSVVSPNLISEKEVGFKEESKSIRLDKTNNKLFLKNFNDLNECEFDLDEIISVVNDFFEFNTQKVINLIEIHLFIGLLSNLILDTKNIDIVEGLLGSLHGTIGEAGLDIIKKIISIFLGIIKYSNLSTIAISKSSTFLYDLMLECHIPKPQILIDNNVTSPIKIFNFLIQNYIKKLNEEVNSDNKKVHDFTFKSKTRISYDENGENVQVEDLDSEVEIKMKIKEEDKDYKSKVKINDGKYEVEDAVSDGSVSKFIFKHIRNFGDYKRIIKFFKIVNKQELIILLQKYEINFLINVIDLIYFRKKTELKELERMLDIIIDFTAIESRRNCQYVDGVLRMDYSLVKNFDFIVYDDTLMMIQVLNFDSKKDFNKIRTWAALNDYHDNLVKFFGALKDEEKNGSIMDFVSKFRYLESRNDYSGPLEIRLLCTPAMIINEGIEMRHSASAYASNVAQGWYLMGQVYDLDTLRGKDEPPRYTIGFSFNKLTGLEFDQVKGFANEGIDGDGIPKKKDRFKKLMMEWLTIKDISYRPIKDLKLTGSDLNDDGKL